MQFAGPSHDSICWSKVSTGHSWTSAVARMNRSAVSPVARPISPNRAACSASIDPMGRSLTPAATIRIRRRATLSSNTKRRLACNRASSQ